MGVSIEKLNLESRAFNCLSDAGIETVEELVQRSSRDLLALKSFGRVSLNEVNARLRDMGLRLTSSFIQARNVARQIAEIAGGDLSGSEVKATKLILELIQNAEKYSRLSDELTPGILAFHTSTVVTAIEELSKKIEEKSERCETIH